jgi:hypothetical protein
MRYRAEKVDGTWMTIDRGHESGEPMAIAIVYDRSQARRIARQANKRRLR